MQSCLPMSPGPFPAAPMCDESQAGHAHPCLRCIGEHKPLSRLRPSPTLGRKWHGPRICPMSGTDARTGVITLVVSFLRLGFSASLSRVLVLPQRSVDELNARRQRFLGGNHWSAGRTRSTGLVVETTVTMAGPVATLTGPRQGLPARRTGTPWGCRMGVGRGIASTAEFVEIRWCGERQEGGGGDRARNPGACAILAGAQSIAGILTLDARCN